MPSGLAEQFEQLEWNIEGPARRGKYFSPPSLVEEAIRFDKAKCGVRGSSDGKKKKPCVLYLTRCVKEDPRVL